jgi:Xaa-Pro aminopeptidase
MVFAIEPLLFCEEKGFAVFVEDNILVTADGHEVLSSGLPYGAEEIEAVMAQPGIIEAIETRRLEPCAAAV